MLKPLAMLIVFSVCSLLGVQRTARLHRKAELLSALESDIKRMMIHMEYARKPIPVILSECAQGELRPLWRAFAAGLRGGADMRCALDAALGTADVEIAGFTAIDEETRSLLRAFSETLGGTELAGQRQNAAMLLAGLIPLRERAESESGTKGRLYRMVGMLCGTAAVILML